MTKSQLIEALKPFSDDMEITIRYWQYGGPETSTGEEVESTVFAVEPNPLPSIQYKNRNKNKQVIVIW